MKELIRLILDFFLNLFSKGEDAIIDVPVQDFSSAITPDIEEDDEIIIPEIKEEQTSYIMKYFSIEELCMSTTAKRKGIDNTPSDEVVAHLTELVEMVLDPLRIAWGAPLVISSGYRCPELNKAVGGAATSSHMSGYAVDIHPSNLKNKKFLAFTLSFLKENNIPWDQVINEYPDADGNPSWVHIGFKNSRGEQRRQEKTIS